MPSPTGSGSQRKLSAHLLGKAGIAALSQAAHQFAAVLHVDAVGKKPELAVAEVEVGDVGAGGVNGVSILVKKTKKPEGDCLAESGFDVID